MDGENDDIVEDVHGLGVGTARELIDGLGELGRAEDFGRVQAAVDPDHGLAFGGEGVSLSVGQAFGMGQLLRNALVLREQLVVRGRSDDRHQLVATFRGLADDLGGDAIGGGIDLLHVLGELGVVRQAVVVADGEPVNVLGGGDPGLLGLDGGARHEQA